MDFYEEDLYHTPRICNSCGGVMIFEGVGEYRCEECGEKAYDDYGKVRRFIEEHPRATAVMIESAIGVSQRTIRHMLKEGKLEVTADSRSFMHCEVCGKAIRSGRFCPECEMAAHRNLEAKQREQNKKKIQGFGLSKNGEEGQRRFTRRDR